MIAPKPSLLHASLGLLVLLSSCGPQVGGQSRAARLNSARNAAITWVSNAEVAASSQESHAFITRIQSVRNSLKDSKLFIDLDKEGPCSQNTEDRFTLAWVVPWEVNDEMNICIEIFNYSNNVISQVLIHESLHLTDTLANLYKPDVECSTTKDELKIMTYARQRPFRNAYVDDDGCNINAGDYDFVDVFTGWAYRLMFSEELVPRKPCQSHIPPPFPY
jgi:hypothetical protein